MATIITKVESARGCGYRKGGGLYLVSGGTMVPCGLLPLRLDVCPVCHHGIHPARGWTWIDVSVLLKAQNKECPLTREYHHAICPMNGDVSRAGLLWIGEKFYPAPQDFMQEAHVMGVSRRISAVPKEFEVGKTWVFFAHRKTFVEPCPGGDHTEDCECEGEGKIYGGGIFHAFKPTAVEYVITGDETEEELDRMEKRGLTLVKVVKSGGPLLEEIPADEEEA